jgi:aldehyde dehydrogenase (NAD+)
VNAETESLVLNEVFSKLREKASIMRTEGGQPRKERLKALKHWIRKNERQLQKAAYNDLRKPELEFSTIEILYVLNEIKTALNNLDRWTRPKLVDATLEMFGTRSYIRYEPRGVCLVLAPWNYPFSLCIGPLISALAAGNTVVIKPSELTPYISAEIKRMSEEIFEPSVVSVVEGNVEVAQELLKLPFDHIFFTGPQQGGKAVMKAAADNLTSVTLELGGKSPAIVTRSARIKEAAERIVVAKFVNAGQTCVAPDYVLVDKAIAKNFIDQVTMSARHAFSNKSHFPKIVSRKHFERLTVLMTDAIEKGATVELTDAPNREDLMFYPTILSNVSWSSSLMHEEIFGPILPILTFSTIEEAISLINLQSKPLGLYLFSQSNGEMDFILSATSSGGACINDCAIQFLHNNLPFGGVNASGMGKAHGYYGFLTFSNEKPILRQRNGFTSVKIFYPPYTRRAQNLLNTFIKLFYR